MCQFFVIVLENGAVFERQLPGEVFIQGGAVAASEHFLLATPALRFGAGQGAGLEWGNSICFCVLLSFMPHFLGSLFSIFTSVHELAISIGRRPPAGRLPVMVSFLTPLAFTPA